MHTQLSFITLNNEEYLDINMMAAHHNVTRRTIYNWIPNAELKAKQFMGHWLFPKKEALAFEPPRGGYRKART
jgi:hypothetical protein